MSSSVDSRLSAALAEQEATAETKSQFAAALLESANRHSESLSRRLYSMVIIAAVWAMVSLGSIEVKDMAGVTFKNVLVVDLLALPVSAFFYYQAMLSVAFIALTENARRAYFRKTWPELGANSLDELLASCNPISEENSIANLEIDSRSLRWLADAWVGFVGFLIIIGPGVFFAWAIGEILGRQPGGTHAATTSAVMTGLFAARGFLAALQGFRVE
jgi:hypothetical protein